jgi:quercetin dioxygenase-like cupin family protein
MLQASQFTSQTQRGEGMNKYKSILVAAIGLATLAISGVTASATPGNGGFHPGPQLRGTLLSQDVHLNADRIKFQTKDATDVVVQEINQDVGGDSGWHSHPGFVVGIVKSGSVSITVGCATTLYSAGQTFLETGNTPTIARNASSTDPLVVEVTYFVPKGVPTRRDANPPTC